MTAGQYEQYVEQASDVMLDCDHNGIECRDPMGLVETARAVLEAVGPRIAEDTRDRLVAAANQAVVREPVVDAGRLVAWLRHEMAGAASQREVDAYERVLRMVEKGGERDMYDLYYCPASGEIERKPGGGFDVCCDRVAEHQPIAPEAVEAARRLPPDPWAKFAALRKVHAASPVPQPSQFTTWCSNCNCAWPCPTAKILDGVAGGQVIPSQTMGANEEYGLRSCCPSPPARPHTMVCLVGRGMLADPRESPKGIS
jgi:hypothetical protein